MSPYGCDVCMCMLTTSPAFPKLKAWGNYIERHVKEPKYRKMIRKPAKKLVDKEQAGRAVECVERVYK